MKTETLTLAAAMDVLAREIKCDDGVATAAIAEAAQRLRELEWEIASLTSQLRAAGWVAENIIRAREATIGRLHDKIERLTVALKDAISTYDPNREVTLVSAERQEAWSEALKW
jgi:SMC interacting uncharacterized protein involved in chromosome segregation